MHDGDALGGVRMRVVLGRLAMGGPARVSNAEMTTERRRLQFCFQVFQLALGAAALQMRALQRRNTGRIVAAIFEALERIDQLIGNRPYPKNPDNAAHADQYP